jgi:hypothetical protein
MRQLVILIFGLGIMGCGSYDYKVNNLEYRKVRFEDLPTRVKDLYYDPTDFMDDYGNVTSLVSLDDTNEFELETINTWIGPWVAYEKLIDISNGISYRIDKGMPHPFVIYKNKLYLTNKFNVFTTIKDYSTLEFTCYSLKDK